MKKRLTIEDRILIENLLKLNYKLKDISNIVECQSSTISREIKKRRITGKGIYKECEKTKRFPFVCNGIFVFNVVNGFITIDLLDIFSKIVLNKYTFE